MDTDLLLSLCKSVQHFRSFLLEENMDDEDEEDVNASASTSTSSSSSAVAVPASLPPSIRNHPELQSLFRPRKPYKVPRIDANTITPLQFLQRFVIPRKPCILLNATDDWYAMTRWKGKQGLTYLRQSQIMSTNLIDEALRTNPTCTFTPNGRADAIYYPPPPPPSSNNLSNDTTLTDAIFLQPVEQAIPFATILDILEQRARMGKVCSSCSGATNLSSPSPSASASPSSVSSSPPTDTLTSIPCGYAYLSVQNDNLRTQLPFLLNDLGKERTAKVAVGMEAFGLTPDAINIWIGYHGNTSSLHKDHYENLLTVITGIKRFILYPPTDIIWLYERLYSTGKFIHHPELCRKSKDNDCGIIPPDECSTNPFVIPPNSSPNPHASLPLPSCWSIQIDQQTTYTPGTDNDASLTTSSSSSRSTVTTKNVRIPWISIDPEYPNYDRFPLAYFTSPITVDIHANETLYLPSLWYHQVSHPYTFPCSSCGKGGYERHPQYSSLPRTTDEMIRTTYNDSNDDTGITIAINSWFDMNYLSQHWATYNTMKDIANLVTRNCTKENENS